MIFMDVVVCWFPFNFGYEGNWELGLDVCCIHHVNGSEKSLFVVESDSLS